MRGFELTLARTHLIYCIRETEPDWYIALNRNYKPIGQLDGEWSDYPQHLWFKLRRKEQVAKICKSSGEVPGHFYLYSDASVPVVSTRDMQEYAKRLYVLTKQMVVDRKVPTPKPTAESGIGVFHGSYYGPRYGVSQEDSRRHLATWDQFHGRDEFEDSEREQKLRDLGLIK